jgi:hypothetical protein
VSVTCPGMPTLPCLNDDGKSDSDGDHRECDPCACVREDHYNAAEHEGHGNHAQSDAHPGREWRTGLHFGLLSIQRLKRCNLMLARRERHTIRVKARTWWRVVPSRIEPARGLIEVGATVVVRSPNYDPELGGH